MGIFLIVVVISMVQKVTEASTPTIPVGHITITATKPVFFLAFYFLKNCLKTEKH